MVDLKYVRYQPGDEDYLSTKFRLANSIIGLEEAIPQYVLSYDNEMKSWVGEDGKHYNFLYYHQLSFREIYAQGHKWVVDDDGKLITDIKQIRDDGKYHVVTPMNQRSIFFVPHQSLVGHYAIFADTQGMLRERYIGYMLGRENIHLIKHIEHDNFPFVYEDDEGDSFSYKYVYLINNDVMNPKFVFDAIDNKQYIGKRVYASLSIYGLTGAFRAGQTTTLREYKPDEVLPFKCDDGEYCVIMPEVT